MTKEFKEAAQQLEQKEEIKEPKISFQILYHSHRTAKDIEKLAEIFPKIDIYIPERHAWTPEFLTDLQSLSRGEKTPQELNYEYGYSEGSPWAKRFEIIYQSQKPILFADLGAGHELEDMYDQSKGLYRLSFYKFRSGEFQRALQMMRNYIIKFAEYILAREEIIKTNLETRIQELVKNNSRLEDKKEIKVLLSLGSAHTRLYRSLKKESPSTIQQFSNLPTIFMSEGEAIRRAMFSKEVKDELLAKIFIEDPLYNHLIQIIDDSDKVLRALQKMTAKISLDEIKDLSENWTDEQSGGLPLILRKFFENKGIKIPETEKEIDEMLT